MIDLENVRDSLERRIDLIIGTKCSLGKRFSNKYKKMVAQEVIGTTFAPINIENDTKQNKQ